MKESTSAQAQARIRQVQEDTQGALGELAAEVDRRGGELEWLRGELEQTDSARMEAVRKLEDAQAEWEGVKGKLEAQVMALTDELEAGNESVEIVKVQAVKAQRAVQTTQKALEGTEAKYREHRGRMVAKLAVKFMQSQLRGEFDTWRDLTIASKLDLRMSWMDEERESLESPVSYTHLTLPTIYSV